MTSIRPPEGMPIRSFEKYERDGEVAVLISPGFGAGWSTWASDEQKQALAFDRRLVECVLAGGFPTEELLDEVLGDGHGVYMGGACVKVEWVTKGERFYIHEYDGCEWIVDTSDLIWTA